ncbi:MAG: alpha/beta fold hydrolase, partial [Thermoanaerobaculia bacterium]
MRKTATILIWTISLTVAAAAWSQEPVELSGHWEGAIEVPGQPLQVKVDLALEAGEWSGTIDIPAQGVRGLALDGFSVEEGEQGVEVRFAIRGVPGNPTFLGKLEDGEIRGIFTQGGARLRFVLGRDAVEAPARPQEPRPPFPYEIEEARYPSGDVQLAGTLTVPPGDGPFPAVLLISGSGAQDRNEEIFGHKPFLVLADHLTRAGIAVLRVDDPGVGGSTAYANPATTADFAGDAEAGLEYLKGHPRVDPGRIGIVGHSEGGAIAPIVASRSEVVAFIVLLAGPGMPGSELLRKQNERIFEASGFDEKRWEKLGSLLDELFDALTDEEDSARRRERVLEVVRRQFEVNGIARDQQDPAQVELAAEGADNAWMRYFLAYDPRPALRATRVPVLAVNGELDLQVDAEQNLTAIEAALEEAGNDDV